MFATMMVCKPNGTSRTLKGTRTLKEYLWQVKVVKVVADEAGYRALFYTQAGLIFVGMWDDGRELWDWLHSRRTLQGCPLRWRYNELQMSFNKVGKYDFA